MILKYTNYPLEDYVYDCEGVELFKERHIVASGLALVVATAVGLIAYAIFNSPCVSLGLGMSGKIAASIAVGTTTIACACVGILIHYIVNIGKRLDHTSKEVFFEALIHSTSADIFHESRGEPLVALRLSSMINNMDEKSYCDMIRLFDYRFFRFKEVSAKNKTAEVYNPYLEEEMLQVYSLFFQAAPERFITTFFELSEGKPLGNDRVETLLSEASQKYLFETLRVILEKSPESLWTSLMIEVDHLRSELPAEARNSLNSDVSKNKKLMQMQSQARSHLEVISFLFNVDRKKFVKAYARGKTDQEFSKDFENLIEYNLDKNKKALQNAGHK